MLITDSKSVLDASSATKNIIVTTIIIIIVLAGVFYYLWVPAPGHTEKKTRGFGAPHTPQAKINPFLAKLKSRINETIEDYKKQKEKEANAPPKYNFHKKNRWS